MIPTLPAFFDMYYTQPSGKLTPDGYLYNDQTFQALNAMVLLVNTMIQSLVSNDGHVINQGLTPPSYTTAEIVALEPDSPNGTTWFNTTLAKLQVKTASGVIETITST